MGYLLGLIMQRNRPATRPMISALVTYDENLRLRIRPAAYRDLSLPFATTTPMPGRPGLGVAAQPGLAGGDPDATATRAALPGPLHR
jgi:hypothetical protein